MYKSCHVFNSGSKMPLLAEVLESLVATSLHLRKPLLAGRLSADLPTRSPALLGSAANKSSQKSIVRIHIRAGSLPVVLRAL